MAFASRCGLEIDLASSITDALGALFAEELGAIVQVDVAHVDDIIQAARDAGIEAIRIGRPVAGSRVRVRCGDAVVLDESRADLHLAWSATTHAMQRMRDNPQAADQEYARLRDESDPGLVPLLTFEVDALDAPFVSRGRRPRVAILREQGVNGQVEMAAAFTRAGFDAFDVHMTDIAAGRHALGDFQGVVACGGFSYGDVLGAGEGWAKSILFDGRLRDRFAEFFARGDTFALGVCNGCQMMSNLHEIIPGTAHWPHFVRNASDQFEARFVMLEVLPTPSLFFDGMQGSRIPVAMAHGEGLAEFRDAQQLAAAQPFVALRFVDHRGRPYGNLPVQSERVTPGHHRPHHRERALHDPDAASGARVPHGADVVASGRVGRCVAVVPDVRQRAPVRRMIGCATKQQRNESHHAARIDRLLDQRGHARRRSVRIRPPIRRSDRRRHRRRRLLHRTLRGAARRFRQDRDPRGGQPAGFLRRTRVSGHRHDRCRGRPHRSLRSAARLRRRTQCASRDERRHQRQRRHRRIRDRRRDGVRQGADDRAAADARCGNAGAGRPRTDGDRACVESRRDAKLPGACTAQSFDDACDVAAIGRRGGPQADRVA
jgi:phosphoribosylformylglycinamidine (FGAM) synthase-like amidotransferase family enzyme